MKALIVYATKYGCTADCAAYLQSKLPGGATLHDINSAAQVELDGYDTIIIGAPVYVGKVAKKLRGFCESNLDVIVKKRVGVFLCCALAEQAGEALAGNFPKVLLDNAVITKVFGSEARLDKMSFIDKTMIKMVTKGDFSNFKISYDNIDEFVREIIG